MEGLFSIFKIPLVQSSLWALALALATAIAARVATRILKRYLNQESNPLPSSSIIINIARGVIWATGISVILDACFGVNANALVAALGVGGIAVSLGFQDTLSNLIGGLQVTFMGIVKPGDNIEVGAEAGVVQDVTWRHTTIRDAMGQTVIIPNSIISKTALVHLLPANRVVVPFAVPRVGEDGCPVLRDLGARHQGQDHSAGRGHVEDLRRCRRHRARYRSARIGPSRSRIASAIRSPRFEHRNQNAAIRVSWPVRPTSRSYTPSNKWRSWIGIHGRHLHLPSAQLRSLSPTSIPSQQHPPCSL